MKRSRILLIGVAVGLSTLLLAAIASRRGAPPEARDPGALPSAYAQFQPAGEASKELKNLALQYHDRLDAAEQKIAARRRTCSRSNSRA